MGWFLTQLDKVCLFVWCVRNRLTSSDCHSLMVNRLKRILCELQIHREFNVYGECWIVRVCSGQFCLSIERGTRAAGV